jgi:hypothetical protein
MDKANGKVKKCCCQGTVQRNQHSCHEVEAIISPSSLLHQMYTRMNKYQPVIYPYTFITHAVTNALLHTRRYTYSIHSETSTPICTHTSHAPHLSPTALQCFGSFLFEIICYKRPLHVVIKMPVMTIITLFTQTMITHTVFCCTLYLLYSVWSNSFIRMGLVSGREYQFVVFLCCDIC